ncbi:NNP family nitrate/nitrite transporter-like MFS transporter [Thermosporothrix hazakensis]|uniref:NNP family nitrate/nitrite transporter-like MFS transporter n=1 Tax=Thermosporothrix hazakensis TaxID=644383 RepID=A0A326U9I3_THEHA|nr:nitrate/nitrite transporter [Thermosporothrix hazakensis]PZW31266.1 NNP family nitrate/nitrite transporter-like MFS transporter [Thermosporothrix hazakensis]GCE50820.1 nitrite extrusion protein [Thermosporothrix hazakensis]
MPKYKAWIALLMATLSFTITFAVWSLLSPLATQIQQEFHLSEIEVSIMLAVPVILGSLARIPMGLLTDRFGGRRVMTFLLLFTAAPLLGMTTSTGLWGFLLWGFLLGVAGSSFAVGVPLVNSWFPPERQGLVIGIFGIGNVGSAISASLAPQISKLAGNWRPNFWAGAIIILVMALAFYLLVSDAPQAGAKKQSARQQLTLLKRKEVWLLSLFYFVTFGGLVAFGLYLPKLLIDNFGLDKIDAGNRTAIFVMAATFTRPLGGWLSDKVSARLLVRIVFTGLPVLALILAFQPTMPILTICFLLIALLLGIGNGAVFKLVPQQFPKEAGTVTGLVGAAGGLGGFFPPIVMGMIKTMTGAYTLGYIPLALLAALCLFFSLRGTNNLMRAASAS